MTADNGKPPDAIFCAANVQCPGIWPLLQQQGYKGYFFHGLYSDALVKIFNGSYVNHPYPNFQAAADVDGLHQMQTDIDAIYPEREARPR